MLTREALTEKLISEFNYSVHGAESLAGNILNLTGKFRSAAEKYLADGTKTEFYAEGYSLSGLMKQRGFNYLNALSVIDWLMKEPENARKALSAPIHRIRTGE